MRSGGTPELMAFYGTLREEAVNTRAPGKAGLLWYAGPCKLSGVLFDYGPYPGFHPATDGTAGVVAGDLYEVMATSAFTVFDDWEDYDPADEASSDYQRRRIRLVAPEVEAWVYVSNMDPAAFSPIRSGDWVHHCRLKNRSGARVIG